MKTKVERAMCDIANSESQRDEIREAVITGFADFVRMHIGPYDEDEAPSEVAIGEAVWQPRIWMPFIDRKIVDVRFSEELIVDEDGNNSGKSLCRIEYFGTEYMPGAEPVCTVTADTMEYEFVYSDREAGSLEEWIIADEDMERVGGLIEDLRQQQLRGEMPLVSIGGQPIPEFSE